MRTMAEQPAPVVGPHHDKYSVPITKRLGSRLAVVEDTPPTSPILDASLEDDDYNNQIIKGVGQRLERPPPPPPPLPPPQEQQEQQQQQSDPDELKLWDTTDDEAGTLNGGSVSTDNLSIKPRRARRRKPKQQEKSSSSKRRDKKEKSTTTTPTRSKLGAFSGARSLLPSFTSPTTKTKTPEKQRPSTTNQSSTPDTVIMEEEEEESDDSNNNDNNNNEGDWFGESEYYASIEVVQKLKNKDIKDIIIYVDDYDTSTFQLLIENLLENTVLTAVKVYRLQCRNNRRIRSTPEMARLFSAIRALRNLETLDLCNMEETELEMITSIIKRHPTLTTFALHLTHGGIVDTDLLQEMAFGAPLLTDISIEVHKSFPLKILFESKRLTSIRVWSHQFKFQDDHFVAAMQTLEHNDTLRTLDLKPRISSLGLRALSFAVDENQGLTTLKFSFKDPNCQGKMLLHLVHALTRNSKLRVIQNYSASQVQVGSADETRMMELLESNTVIEQLEIFDDADCASFKERLLRDNKDRNINGRGFFAELFSCGSIFQCGDGECGEDFEEAT